MGDMADDLIDSMIWGEPRYDDDGFDYTKLWKTKDGMIIEICKMTDSHLLNSIEMTKRKGKDNKYLDAEYKRRLSNEN